MSVGHSKSMIKLDGAEGASKLEHFLKNNNCIIRFHMYGCMWCNKMKPEWDKLADCLSKKNSQFIVLDVDSDAVSNMSNPMKSSINGYPTIVYSPKGMSEKHSKFEDESGRTADNIEKWLMSVSKQSQMSRPSLSSSHMRSVFTPSSSVSLEDVLSSVKTKTKHSSKPSKKKSKKTMKKVMKKSRKLSGGSRKKSRKNRKMHRKY